MKKVLRFMSKYGGSEKQYKLLLQHITSRGSRLATRRPPLLREDESSSPLLPRLSGLLQPWSDVGLGTLGGQSLLDVTGPSSPHRLHCPLPGTCCPNKLSSLCSWTRPPAQEQHAVLCFMVCTGFPAPSSFSAFLQPTTSTE